MKDTSWFVNTGENADTLTVTIRKPSTVYLDEFFRLRCAPDILVSGVFNCNNPAKEISESMAVFNAVRRTIGDNRLREGFLDVVSVGDGSTPRTATIFAYRSKARCFSIDPLAKEEYEGKVERLHIIKKPIEQVRWGNWTETILVACHSHADLTVAARIIKPTVIVAMECCVPQVLTVEPNYPKVLSYREYHDWGVWSDKRGIKVWKLQWYDNTEIEKLSKTLERFND